MVVRNEGGVVHGIVVGRNGVEETAVVQIKSIPPTLCHSPISTQTVCSTSLASGTLQQNLPVGDMTSLSRRYKLISPLSLLSLPNSCKALVCITIPPLGYNQFPAVLGLLQQGVLFVVQTSW